MSAQKKQVAKVVKKAEPKKAKAISGKSKQDKAMDLQGHAKF